MVVKGKYFCGNEVSQYGQQMGYVDFRTLSKCGDMVLCNDITKLFWGSINGEYIEPEQVNGAIDNSEEIDELQEKIDELQEKIDELEEEIDNLQSELEDTPTLQEQIDTLQKTLHTTQEQIDELEEEIEELEEEQREKEIFQYYIISDNLAHILQHHTNEIVYYIEHLDIYIWGVTHWGTSWDYVLTNIKIELEEDQE